ncbi:MAG: histidine--tRNA ligase [Halanaerobiales bacterium]
MGINAPRGTNDILPPASLQWGYIVDKARSVFTCGNYQEIKTPIFEYTELFTRGIGEDTDIVEKEMYTFEDKGGRSLTLRPEGTASVVRSFMENKIYGEAQPNKYFYFGPMFRYERPQSGRYRQFYQIGVEVLGSNDPAVDAEIITLGMNFLHELGLKDLDLYINSIGCPECRAEYVDDLKEYLESYRDKLCADCSRRLKRNPLRILDCKQDECKQVIASAPRITDFLCQECEDHFSGVMSYLELANMTYEVDSKLVRGLDYYTNTAFEIKFSGLGAQDTIFGGGRYNGLAGEIGGRSVPGAGFALGVERLIMTLEKQEIELPVKRDIDLYITTIGEKAKNAAFSYVNELRKSGLKTVMDYLGRSVKGQMKDADRKNSTFTIILGENELETGRATVRNMKTGEEKEVELDKLVDVMLELIE